MNIFLHGSLQQSFRVDDNIASKWLALISLELLGTPTLNKELIILNFPGRLTVLPNFSVFSSSHHPLPKMISCLLFVHTSSIFSFLSSVAFTSFNSLGVKDFLEYASRSKKKFLIYYNNYLYYYYHYELGTPLNIPQHLHQWQTQSKPMSRFLNFP